MLQLSRSQHDANDLVELLMKCISVDMEIYIFGNCNKRNINSHGAIIIKTLNLTKTGKLFFNYIMVKKIIYFIIFFY